MKIHTHIHILNILLFKKFHTIQCPIIKYKVSQNINYSTTYTIQEISKHALNSITLVYKLF